MERLSPVGIENAVSGGSAFPAAYFSLEMKWASGAPVNSPADSENDDLDGCCVPVEVATPDEELPAAEGGVA